MTTPPLPPPGHVILTETQLRENGAVEGMLFWNYQDEKWSAAHHYEKGQPLTTPDQESIEKQPWCAPLPAVEGGEIDVKEWVVS